MTDIFIWLDNNKYQVPENITILEAATRVGLKIPTICFHSSCTANALCRICVVEVEGARTLIPACVAKVSPEMKILTNSDRVRKTRKTILELLVSTIDLSQSPEILDLVSEYSADINRFPDAKRRNPPLIDDNPMYVRDYSKCILCWRCVQVCADDAQYTYAINFRLRGFDTLIGTFYNKPMMETNCVFCGQCVGVCPTNALKPKKEWLLENNSPPEEIIVFTRQDRKKHSKYNDRGI